MIIELTPDGYRINVARRVTRVDTPAGELVRLGRRIRVERERRGLTVRGVALAAGVGDTTLRNIERGRTANTSLETLFRIVTALGLRFTFGVEEVTHES